MLYGTVCSGIEAPSVAWSGLGWGPQWFSEIEPFPKAVLAHHYPNVPDLGDMTKVNWNDQAPIDLLIGGTPCQSFSVAGLRKGLADPRGNLALGFLRIVGLKRPRWVVWENVPGVLSSNGGRDFGAFLGALVKLGYGFSYRVLDAQNFGVPQRRRRVFVVANSGGWAGPAAVLFEQESLRGNPAPSRKAKAGVAALTASGVGTCGADDNQAQAGHIVVPPLDASYGRLQGCSGQDMKHNHGHLVRCTEQCASTIAVRRLTPVECERLQGLPDNYTRIPWRGKSPEGYPSGHRYKALGNSMAVPVVRWIGERIETLTSKEPK